MTQKAYDSYEDPKWFSIDCKNKYYHVLPIHAGIGHIVADLFSQV